MGIFSYLRVSSQQQVLDRQELEMQQFCEKMGIAPSKVYKETFTGTKVERPVFTMLVEEILRDGDILIVCSLDRLSRSKKDLKDLMYQFNNRGIKLVVCNLPTTYRFLKQEEESEIESLLNDTISAILFELLAFFSEEEVRSKKERQQQGYAALRASGRWEEVLGRPRAITQKDFNDFYKTKVLTKEVKVKDAMQMMGISMATYYRYKKNYDMVFKK